MKRESRDVEQVSNQKVEQYLILTPYFIIWCPVTLCEKDSIMIFLASSSAKIEIVSESFLHWFSPCRYFKIVKNLEHWSKSHQSHCKLCIYLIGLFCILYSIGMLYIGIPDFFRSKSELFHGKRDKKRSTEKNTPREKHKENAWMLCMGVIVNIACEICYYKLYIL